MLRSRAARCWRTRGTYSSEAGSSNRLTCTYCPLNSNTDGESKMSLTDCICDEGYYLRDLDKLGAQKARRQGSPGSKGRRAGERGERRARCARGDGAAERARGGAGGAA